MRVKNAPKRWKDMVQVSGDVTSLKRSGGRLRKVTKHSPEEQVLEKLTEDDPYASTEILACWLLNKSGTNISSRAVCWQLYSRADERFSYKTPIKTTWSESLTCRWDTSKACTMQSINPSVVHKNFTLLMNARFFSVSYHEKAIVEKANSFMEEFPTVWRSTLYLFCDRTKRLLQSLAFRKQYQWCRSQELCAQRYSTSSICTKPWQSSTAYGNSPT